MKRTSLLLLALLASNAAPALAQSSLPGPAAGIEVVSSTDSDNFDVLKLSGRFLWLSEGKNRYRGISLERAWYDPDGASARRFNRVYLEAADDIDNKWIWRVRAGTDGRTVFGAASIRAADWSKEFFVERDIIESRQGVRKRLFHTIAGASFDISASERDTFNIVAAVQGFAGDNERLHLRWSYIRVIHPNMGLSGQLRARYYHSTKPGEFDYFSPRDFVQLLPVAQIRRFDADGWMYLAATGLGLQKSTGSKWQGARLVELRVESPAARHGLQAIAQIQYSNSSISGGSGDYHYVAARGGLTARF